MAKLQKTTTAGFNAGTNIIARMVRLDDIVIDPEIASIFKIQDKTFQSIKKSIEKFGFFKEEPVILWKGRNILIDGRTRYTAAKEAGLEEIPAFEREFADEIEAILYTFGRQALRRNLTNEEIFTAVQMIPDIKSPNGTGRAAETIAKMLCVSLSTIYCVRKLIKKAPDDILQSVKNEKMSIKKGTREMKKRLTPKAEKEVEFHADDSQSLSPKVSFLKGAVILLVEFKEQAAAELLINHYLGENEKHDFASLLPKTIASQLSTLEISMLTTN